MLHCELPRSVAFIALVAAECGEVNRGGRGCGALPDLPDWLAGRQVRLAGEQVIDGRCQRVGVVEVVLVERQVGRVGQLPGGADEFGVQPLGVGVGLRGALPVLAVLLA